MSENTETPTPLTDEIDKRWSYCPYEPADYVIAEWAVIAAHCYEDMRTQARALERRAIAAEQARGWRPIESAPRDGTRVLAFCRGTYDPLVTAASWDAELDEWTLEADVNNLLFGEPTHWMPLPDGPGEGEHR